MANFDLDYGKRVLHVAPETALDAEDFSALENAIAPVMARQGALNGLVIDYVTEGVNSLFKFRNPNATGECGCGESFTVEEV